LLGHDTVKASAHPAESHPAAAPVLSDQPGMNYLFFKKECPCFFIFPYVSDNRLFTALLPGILQ
jgi:hypothetical protein